MLKIGIVGLPNVGKSTFFNIVTKLDAEVANYPFATINPNIGVIDIIDDRLLFLQKHFSSEKTIFNQIQFVDIAGLVRGASKGEGLGNKFLENIRSVDIILHMIRFFSEKEIIHVDKNISPLRDLETINLELILSDLEKAEKWLTKNTKILNSKKDEKIIVKKKIIDKVIEILRNEELLITYDFSELEKEEVKEFNFLTLKPIIFLLNFSENEISNYKENSYYKEFISYVNKRKWRFDIVPFSAKIELDLLKIDNFEEKKEFMDFFNLDINENKINMISQKSLELLNYGTFFTAGKQEARAWQFKKGMTAPETAEIIHTDFRKGFIKVEVYNFNDFIEYKSESELKKKGLIRIEGKEYLVKDGDVCYFRFNV